MFTPEMPGKYAFLRYASSQLHIRPRLLGKPCAGTEQFGFSAMHTLKIVFHTPPISTQNEVFIINSASGPAREYQLHPASDPRWDPPGRPPPSRKRTVRHSWPQLPIPTRHKDLTSASTLVAIGWADRYVVEGKLLGSCFLRRRINP